MCREGDIVEIPLPDGRTAIGWIVHVSRHFKDAVGFIVFGIKGQLREDYVEEASRLSVLGPLYTHVNAIKHYRWTVSGHHPVSEATRLLTRRRVGGDVYIGDDYIGSADELGERALRPMLAMGMPVVYKEIARAFDGR